MKRKSGLWIVALLLVLVPVLSACQPEVVKETVVVEKIVKETVVVTEEKVVKETVVVTEKEETFDWKQFEGTEIRVLGPTHDFLIVVVDGLLPGFEALTGITVNVEHYPEDQSRDKQQVELLAGNKDLDVLFYQPGRVGQIWNEAGWVEPLDEWVSDPLLTNPDYDYPGDFFQGSIDQGTVDGDLISIVVGRGLAPVLFYNSQILEEYGVEVPTTFEELEAAAKKINEESNGEIYGIVNRGAGSAATSQFSFMMHEFGAAWQDADGNITVNTPEWIEAAEWWGRTLRESGPEGAAAYSWGECLNDMVLGKAAFTLELALNPSRIKGLDPAMAGVLKAVPIPYGPAYDSGGDSYRSTEPCVMPTRFGLSVNAFSEKKGAAWLFIQYMTSKVAQVNYLIVGKPVARNSAYEDPTFKLATKADAWFWEAVGVASNICYSSSGYAPAVLKDQAQARDIIGKAIQGGILGQDVAALAEEAQVELEALLASEQAGQ